MRLVILSDKNGYEVRDVKFEAYRVNQSIPWVDILKKRTLDVEKIQNKIYT